MPSKLQYLLLKKPGDSEFFLEMRAKYTEMDNTALIESYNEALRVGIVGSHLQAVSYCALHFVFEDRFGKSPIKIEQKWILSLTDPIIQIKNSWEFAE